jgi:hypothetical protein
MSLKSVGHWVVTIAGFTRRRFRTLAAPAALGLAAFGVANYAMAGNIFTGQFGTGTSWNMYEGIGTNLTWKEAFELAATRPDPTGGTAVGHLVTLKSQEENDFVQMNAGGNRWIGLTDRVGLAPGATESAFTADPLTNGWAWVTGEPFNFQAWGGGEPNNSGGEDAVHLRGDLLWNDHQIGYGLDQPVPDAESTAEGLQTFPFVIEWSTNSATQPTGFPTTRPDPPQPPLGSVYPKPLARLPGPNGTATAWGTREVVGTGNSGSTIDAINFVLGGTGTNVDGTVPTFDVTDPATNATPVGVIPDPPVDFIAGGGDSFQVVTKGTIRVPAGQGGNYTFSVRSDDGFGLRILSEPTAGNLVQHKFTNASVGRVDADGSLVFLAPTGDSNTRGVINLQEGTYDVEFIMYENGGGAFYEVASAKGDFVGGTGQGTPQWLVLGSNQTVPQTGPFKQAARLNGNVTVTTHDTPVAGLVIADTIAMFRSNPTPVLTGSFNEAIVYDGDDICCGRPGSSLPATQINEFPNGGNDNFMTQMTGAFTVLDTNGAAGETLTFGLFADDNTALHIIGRSFTDAGGDINAMIANPEGVGTDQWLVMDVRTGNSNALGLITLPEGSYNFEAFQMEEGGDSGLEVWVAAGDRLATGIASGAFLPLSAETLPDAFLAANIGLALVAGPGTAPLPAAGLTGDFNGNGAVDAADYVLWRNGGTLQNEGGVTPGTASPEDYQTWRANFGRTAGAGGAAAAGVPEAATLLSAVFAVVCGLFGARARRS